MKTVLKFDKYVLVKEMNEKFKQTGELFEVANILEDSFLLRSAKDKVAIGVVNFSDLDKYFVAAEGFKGWTSWTQFVGFDGQNDASYRTNGKKVQVRFLTSKTKAEACCCKGDDFNLSFGLRVAYLRCLNKALTEKKVAAERELAENEAILKKMINSIDA